MHFLFFLFVFSNKFFIILAVKENRRVKLALTIPAGVPIIFTKEIIDIPSLVTDKTIKVLSK